MIRKIERRVVTVKDLEFRVDGDTSKTLAGHAAVFNKAVDLGYFTEIVRPGAFKRSIGEDDVRALFNHDSNLVLGRNRAGTLTLSEDSVGLAIECRLPDTQLARDLAVSIARGDVSQMSFGFYARETKIVRDGDNYTRELLDCQLFDVSVVTYPAYEDTDVEARSLAAILEDIRRGPEAPPPVDESWKHDLDRRRRLVEMAEQL